VIPGARKIDIPREVKIAQAKPKDSKISNKKTPDTKILAKGGSQGKGKKYSVKYT
jgi:hypothetical protein